MKKLVAGLVVELFILAGCSSSSSSGSYYYNYDNNAPITTNSYI